MKLPSLFSSIVLLITLPSHAADTATYQPPATPRVTYNFNPGWRFIREDVPDAVKPDFDDTRWAAVSTPHTWNETDSYRNLIRHGGGDSGVYMGVGWYRKHFKLPLAAKGQKVLLEFEGLKQAGRFFLNGKPLGKFENGVTACGLDLSETVNFGGDNVLSVKVDNSNDYLEEETRTGYQWMGKAFNPNFGGLNHNVRLHVAGKIYQTLPLYENLKTTGVYVHAAKYDIKAKTAEVTVEAQVRNETSDFASISLSAVLEDAAGMVRARFQGEASDLVAGQTETFTTAGQLTDAHFWGVDDPYLYDVYSILSVDGEPADVVKTRTGFRKAHRLLRCAGQIRLQGFHPDIQSREMGSRRMGESFQKGRCPLCHFQRRTSRRVLQLGQRDQQVQCQKHGVEARSRRRSNNRSA